MTIDIRAEELSFPSIYSGQKRSLKIKLSYTDIAKLGIRRYDRRACKPTKVLYMFKKSFNEKVRNVVQVCLRKNQSSSNITAEQARNPQFLRSIINRDEGYAVFKNVSSSPSYWKKKPQIVVSIRRQIGKCSFFVTLSAAENKWPELLVTLTKRLREKNITVEEAENLSFEEKTYLIKTDPVTCMRHFDHKYRELLNVILKRKGGAF